MYNNTVLVLC